MTSRLAYVGDPHGVLSACRDLIAAAEHSIVLQMYLFASDGDQTLMLPRPGSFAYAEAVAGWLIEKKRARPGLSIVVVLDSNTPSNPALTRRRGVLIRQRLAQAGVVVLNACLFRNRFDARRRLWSAMNLHLDHGHVRLDDWVERQNRWQSLHNVEDHRKNLVIDAGRAGAITSHNFFDAAFDWHENLLWITGDAARQLWSTATAAVATALTIPQGLDDAQRATLRALLATPPSPDPAPLAPTLAPVDGYPGAPPAPAPLVEDEGCALVENEAIRPCLTSLIAGAGKGDELLVATTYFSDLPTLAALADAARRGARVRVLIDSIHALPLPAVASWLTRQLVNHEALVAAARLQRELPGGFELRVHASRDGAMMHLKTAARVGPRPQLLGGQANYTPNSFSGAWLETDLLTCAPAVIDAFARHFEALWQSPATHPLSPQPGLWGEPRDRLLSSVLRFFDRLGLRP